MSAIKGEKLVKKEVTVAWQCDVCYVQTADLSRYEQEWHHFSGSHQDCGNDSVERAKELEEVKNDTNIQ